MIACQFADDTWAPWLEFEERINFVICQFVFLAASSSLFLPAAGVSHQLTSTWPHWYVPTCYRQCLSQNVLPVCPSPVYLNPKFQLCSHSFQILLRMRSALRAPCFSEILWLFQSAAINCIILKIFTCRSCEFWQQAFWAGSKWLSNSSFAFRSKMLLHDFKCLIWNALWFCLFQGLEDREFATRWRQ